MWNYTHFRHPTDEQLRHLQGPYIRSWSVLFEMYLRVDFRFESLDMELQNRLDDKMWLVKHLERTRLLVLDDLIVVKVLLCQII